MQTIFKTSTKQMKIAFDMDLEGEHFLKTLTFKDEFKHLALDMLISLIPEAYSDVVTATRNYSEKYDDCVKTWVKWWDARKANILRAFTRFDAPRSNQAEVIHAG